ncbi:DNA primase [Leptospira fletcheri]|uniref:DNA primase n=1 Tax=Leptospira fletcheri TaxID=2484981 RepID=A0A4R9G4H4_9LEPT|nr:DNA primase [Leptospira fletcheri]TGK06243.1 DNA primase [Leptospira fletcheri]
MMVKSSPAIPSQEQKMTQHPNSEFDIVTLIELAKKNKYERAVAGFQILDRLDRLELPKKIKGRKLAVQAMFALASEDVQYKYVTKEERAAIEQETRISDPAYSKFNGLFEAPQAPISEEDTEEDFIPEETPKPFMDMEDGEEGDDSFDDDEDEDEEENDSDDEDEEEDEEEETEDEEE